MIIGVGLFMNLGYEADWGKLVIYQLIAGIGTGMNFEGPLLSLQAAIEVKDIATATTTFGFMRTISTAISVVVGGVMFQNEMRRRSAQLVAVLGPELAGQVSGGEAAANSEFINSLPSAQRLVVRKAMYQSLRAMWIMYLAILGAGIIAGAFIAVHPLSEERKAAVLGLTDARGDEGEDLARSSGHVLLEERPGAGS
ncbi:hypothetical protein VMCG_05190 [Cytospora schulzeri]|uniref:Major facilitator superfamily (MFS) profile domain-containing protein n=1 Tax=Cytospora schulzeri TaxID=448051 RepID=A0A423WQZ7_9PEZI|nr:hypothetical protein VMCG_05190 [Valsa malicola]